MHPLKTIGSHSPRLLVGFGLVLGLSACSASTTDSGSKAGSGGGGNAGGGGTNAGAGGTNAGSSGAGGTSGGSGGKGGSTAGSGGSTSGSGGTGGSTGGAGGSGGTGGVTGGTGGAGATGGTGGTGGSGNIDTSGFLTDCKGSGDNWGTPQQAGPCSSGVTLYGVSIPFGPYGASAEYNVGQGFENAINSSDNASGCSSFIDAFGADPVGSADLKNTHDLNLALYSVFYPGAMPEGETFPLITWSNGTCAMPEGYGTLLRYIASYGYIVVAANSRYSGSGSPLPGVNAINFMFAENDKTDSKFYQKIDKTKVGAAGHSQGASATQNVANDSRVVAAILFNQGTASKPFLDISGVKDLGDLGSSGMASAVNGAAAPGAYLYYHQVPTAVNGGTTGALAPGHLTLMMEPERVIVPARTWFDMTLKSDPNAKPMFVGASCTLCDDKEYPSMWPPFQNSETASTPPITYGANSKLK